MTATPLSPYAARKAARLRLLRGEYVHVDAGPARAHVRRLLAAHLPARSVAHAAGLSPAFVCDLANGRFERIRPEFARALFAVGFEPVPGQRTVTGAGFVRRVRALAAVGWSLDYQAGRLGMTSPSHLSRLMRAPTVRYGRWAAGAELYREHVGRPGPCDRSRGWARRHGWAPPQAWPAHALDDPHAWPRLRPLWTPPELVDPAAVDAARAGALPVAQLTDAERAYVAVRNETERKGA